MNPDNAYLEKDDQRADPDPPHNLSKGSSLTRIVEEWLFDDQGEDGGDSAAEWCYGDEEAFSLHIAELD